MSVHIANPLSAYYGHYRPGRPVPLRDPSVFMAVAMLPMQTPSDVARVLNGTGRLLPGFEPVAVAFRRRDFGVELSPEALPVVFERDGFRVVRLPHRFAMAQSFSTFFSTMAQVAPLPNGVALPPMPQHVATKESGVRAFWEWQAWHAALGESFVFQMAYELGLVGVTANHVGNVWGILGAADVARFRIFRTSGLAGLVATHQRFVLPSRRKALDHEFARAAGCCVLGGVAATDWTPSALGPYPPLPRTALDDEAESLLAYDRGLFKRNEAFPVLPERRSGEIRALLRQPILSADGILRLIPLIAELAPALAVDLAPALAAIDAGTVRLVCGAKCQMKEPLEFILSPRQLMGQPTDEGWTITVRHGELSRDILFRLVGCLSRIALPTELNERARMIAVYADRPSAWTNYFYEAMIRSFLWSASALLECAYEARRRGIRFDLDPHRIALGKAIDERGYWVVCEQWDEFVSPQEVQFYRAQADALGAAQARQFAPEGPPASEG